MVELRSQGITVWLISSAMQCFSWTVVRVLFTAMAEECCEVIMGHGLNWQVGEHSGFQNKMKRTGKRWWHSESGMFLTVLDSNDQTPCPKLKCIPVRSSITLSDCHGLIVRQYSCSLTERQIAALLAASNSFIPEKETLWRIGWMSAVDSDSSSACGWEYKVY